LQHREFFGAISVIPAAIRSVMTLAIHIKKNKTKQNQKKKRNKLKKKNG
jgi:hypothetical protein